MRRRARSTVSFGFFRFAALGAAAAGLPARGGAALLIGLACLLQPLPAAAQATGGRTPFDIDAETFEYDRARELYVAEGNVVITQGGRSLKADWVSFSNRTRQGVASGNVVVEEGPDRLFGDFLQFHVDDLTGVVFEGELESDESSFEVLGREMRKTGANTYAIEDGLFTTCECPDEGPNPWQIRATHTDIEVGGYATARNNKIDVLGVPVFWLPWARWPVRTSRTTGFLLPTLSAGSRSGIDAGLPFFWAAHEQLNVTVTPFWLSDRGFKGDIDVEYVYGERSWGDAHGAIVPSDSEVSADDSAVIDKRRWAALWRHDHRFPGDWRAALDLRLVSDNEYAFDFRDLEKYSDDRFLESRGFVETHTADGAYGLNAGLWYADDLQNPDDRDRDAFLLQRFPHVELTARTSRFELWDRMLRTVDVQYTNFWSRRRATSVFDDLRPVDDVFFDTGIDALQDGREPNRDGDIVRRNGDVKFSGGRTLTAAEVTARFPGGSVPTDLTDPDGSRDDFFPGPENNGTFDEGEPLADRGSRLVVNPRVSLPLYFASDRFELTPELGLHQTFYSTSAQNFVNRTLGTARVDLRTRLSRTFDLPFGEGVGVHNMEPTFSYLYVTRVSQRDHPLFVPRPQVQQERVRALDLENIVRDPSDRIDGFNGFRVALENRFLRRSGGEDQPLRLWGEVTLATIHDLVGSDRGNFYLDASLYPLSNLRTDLVLGYDYENSELSEGFTRVSYSTESGHDLSVRYRFLENVPRFFEDFEDNDDRFDRFERDFERINQLDFAVRYAITRSWAVTYSTSYSFESSIFLDNTLGLEYISKCECWAVRAEAEFDRSQGFDFSFQYKLLGLGENKVRPF